VRKTCCLIILCFFYLGTAAQSVAVINGKAITQKEFVWIYKKHRPDNTKPTLTDLISFLNIYIDFKLKVLDAKEAGLANDSTYTEEVKNYEKALLQSVPPEARKADFSLAMNEYKDALLLYNISQTKIWDRIEDNEDTLRKYYDAHPEKYSQKTFDDIKSEVAADYQQQMECDWVTGLRKKFAVTVDQALLARLARNTGGQIVE